MSNIKQAQTDEWRPVRTHAVLRRFRRGPGKTKRFAGQSVFALGMYCREKQK